MSVIRNFSESLANLSKVTLLAVSCLLLGLTSNADGGSPFTEVLFVDQFDEGILDTEWRWIDPGDDSSLNFSRYGWLEIATTSRNDLQPRANLDAPRLLRAVSGNFAMETKLERSPDGSFQSGGLLVWRDDDNFIRFDRGTWGLDTIFLQKRDGGLFQHLGDWFLSGNSVYLRLEREEGGFKALYSVDGKKWVTATQFPFDVSDPLMVGLHAVCLDSRNTSTDFDYFKILCAATSRPYRASSQDRLSEKEFQDVQKSEYKRLMERASLVLSETASERSAFAEKSILTDSKTGLKFRKIFSDEKLDVFRNDRWLTLSPDGNMLFTPWEEEHWIIPLREGQEPFRLTAQFDGEGMLGAWSPDLTMFAFVISSTGDVWVMSVSPETGRAAGPPERIFQESGNRQDRYSRPSWSPDGKRLAFMSKRGGNLDIWTVEAVGGAPVQLTHDPNPERYPAWSPDGRYIAFNRYREPQPARSLSSDIWIVSAGDGNAEKLIEDVNDWSLPTWSPDGRYIGFSRIGGEKDSGSYVFRLSDKREFKVIADYPEELSWTLGWSGDSSKILAFSSGYDYQFALKLVSAYGGPWVQLGKGIKISGPGKWSPDGKSIAALGWGDDYGCWIVPAAGGAPARIRLETKPKIMRFPGDTLSPDLKRLAFISEDSSLWVVPISIQDMKITGSPVKVTDHIKRTTGTRPSYYYISWSPDSKKLAFCSTRGGNTDIWMASADGKKLTQITDDPEDETLGYPRAPVWSPDGKTLAYISGGGLWLVPSKGGKPRQISEEASDPTWSPDGKELGFIEKSQLVVVMTLETGEVRNLVDLKANGLDNHWGLSWSPDGGNLAFISYKSPAYRIFLIPAEGGELLELAKDDPGDKYYFAWSPDGKKLSYDSERYVRVRTGSIWEADVEEILSGKE